MGERKLAPVKAMKAVSAACQESVDGAVESANDAMQVRTPGGVFSVRWDDRGSATARPLVDSCGIQHSQLLVVVGAGGHVGKARSGLSICPRVGVELLRSKVA